ncbi:MAG: diguanylate cyclase [Ilumatobacter sp.]
MEGHSITTSQTRRLAEVDAAMRSLNIAMAFIVAGSGAVFAPMYGIWFSLFAAVALAYWALRLSPLGRIGSVRTWNIAMLAAMGGSIAGAALLSGGADSPVVFFAGIIALVAHALFAHLGRCCGLGVGSLIVLAGIDIGLGRSIEPAVFVSAVVIAGYLPFFVDRMVRVEQFQRRRAVVDQLTGCLNRHALDARSMELEAQGLRTDSEISVILFDLDHFKNVNDEHGHGVGDRVLAHVAYETRRHLRRFELVYRLGGEEFAVLLPGAKPIVAERLAENIRAGIEGVPMGGVLVTASFGVASELAPFEVDHVMAVADRRLYAAKALGRNRVVSRDHASDSTIIGADAPA